ncbi:hypothetical protein R75461_07916 [Paraburkholderia nemoris]|nr:hypothetical protein R75461_07916 [Paraburkholderia nemoris]
MVNPIATRPKHKLVQTQLIVLVELRAASEIGIIDTHAHKNINAKPDVPCSKAIRLASTDIDKSTPIDTDVYSATAVALSSSGTSVDTNCMNAILLREMAKH